MQNAKQNVQPTVEELLAIIAAKNTEIEALKVAKPSGKITLKIGQAGGLSVYGLGRFPTTLYASQWERLIADETIADIRKFLADNAGSLKRKGE